MCFIYEVYNLFIASTTNSVIPDMVSTEVNGLLNLCFKSLVVLSRDDLADLVTQLPQP